MDNTKNELIVAKKSTLSLISTIWLIPIIALIIGAWLVVDYIKSTGPQITLYVDSGEGLKEGVSFIKMYDVTVGKIDSIALNLDKEKQTLGKVVLKATMDATVTDLLRQDSAFWLVKPRVEQSSVSGLSTLISGYFIQMTPGQADAFANSFVVSDKVFHKANDELGIKLKLISELAQPISVGAPIIFSGIEIGWVEQVTVDTLKGAIVYDVYIESKHSKLIGKQTKFWQSGGLNFDFDVGKLNINQISLGNLLTGAIEISEPADAKQLVNVNNSEFKLYANRDEIPQVIDTDAVFVVAFFKQDVAGLLDASPIMYRGIEVGRVVKTEFFQNKDKAKLFERKAVPILLAIEPSYFNIQTAQELQEWQKSTTKALQSLDATLTSQSLITGKQFVELVDRQAGIVSYAPQTQYAKHPVIGTVAGGFGQLQANLNSLLTKFNKLPLANTAVQANASLAELKQILQKLNAVLATNELQSLPQEINSTLQQLRQTVQGITPDSRLYQQADKLLQQFKQTMQGAQPLLQQLTEKPNALFFNNSKSEIYPKGAANE